LTFASFKSKISIGVRSGTIKSGKNMNLNGNMSISIKEAAFSDVAPLKKKIDKLVVGTGNGYSTEDRDMRFIKLFFENNPNQTTKTLSYTRPINSTKIKDVLQSIAKILENENYYIEKDLELIVTGISIKDRRELKNFIASVK